METFPTEQEQPINEAIEETEQKIEVSPEVQGIMNAEKEKRVGLLNRVMSEKAAKVTGKIIHFTPLQVPALFTSAAMGESLTGEKLDGKTRFNYAMAGGFLTLSYALFFAGQHKEALAAKGAAATFGGMQFGPELIKNTIAVAKQKIPEMASFIEKTGVYISSHPELIALNLNG